MLKAIYIGSGEKGVSRNYKVTGPSTELAAFKAWNLSQIGRDGMPILRKFPDVLTVPSKLYNEAGEIIGDKPLFFTGIVQARQLLAGERIGQTVYELIPSAYESAVKAVMQDEGIEVTTTLVNLGVINKAELDAATYGMAQELPVSNAVPNITPAMLSNAQDIPAPIENAPAEESKPTTESKNSGNKA